METEILCSTIDRGNGHNYHLVHVVLFSQSYKWFCVLSLCDYLKKVFFMILFQYSLKSHYHKVLFSLVYMMKAEYFFFCSLIYLKIWEIWSLYLWAVPGIGRVLRKRWLSEINDILIYSQKVFFLLAWWTHWNKRKAITDVCSKIHIIELCRRIIEFYLFFCNYLLEKDPGEQNSFPLWLSHIVWKGLLPETHWIKIWTA